MTKRTPSCIIPFVSFVAREWRNWQTRTFEGRVDFPYGFKSRLPHQIMCNDANRSILVCPAASKDNDAVVWKLHNADPPKYRKIECANFSKPLLDRW